jgi:hypothetical protein
VERETKHQPAPDREHPVVPKSYWTFGFVSSILAGIGALTLATYWWLDSRPIEALGMGGTSLAIAVYSAVFYWRLRRGRKLVQVDPANSR